MKARKEEKRFMETKKVELAKGYYAKINAQTNGNIRLYILYNQDNEKVCESYSRDSFLIKANKFVKITNMQECIIASY